LNRIRRAIVEKVDYRPLSPFAIAGIYNTVAKIRSTEPVPLRRTQTTSTAAAR
jgi:hypothetical protein